MGRDAATEFLSRGKRRILDLACGVGRDTFYLEKQGLALIGVDASWNGLKAAHQIKVGQGAMAELVTADARHLPFRNGSFDGIYCFGLLHEFTGTGKEEDVRQVVAEAGRLVPDGGLLVLTVVSGDPQAGLPQVQCFTRQMLLQALAGWYPLEIKSFDDVACTSRTDYAIWYGLFEK